MKSTRIIYVLLICVALSGCSAELEEGGPFLVSVISDTLIGCEQKYKIQFSDKRERVGAGYYKVYLVDVRDNVVAKGDTFLYLTPPFDARSSWVTLKSSDHIREGWNVYAGAASALDTLNVVDWSGSNSQRSYGPVTLPNFDDSCPGSACSFALQLLHNGYVVPEDSIVYIWPEPKMPELTARVAEPNTTWGTLQWNLMITYNRLDREDTSNYRFTASEPTDEWYINPKFGTDIVGGKGILSCRLDTVYDCSTMFYFCIRAENPDEAIIENYIQNLSTSMWYTKYVAKHESGYQNGRYYLQFNEEGNLGCSDDDYQYAPNRNPNPADPGWGLFMLTWFDWPTARYANAQELWSWKENAISGSGWLDYHQVRSNTYMADERGQALLYFGVNHPEQFQVPDETTGNVTFSEGTDRIIEHAVALKRYNGASGPGNGQYCEFHDGYHEWSFNRLNNYDPPFNYVERVCSMVVPAPDADAVASQR